MADERGGCLRALHDRGWGEEGPERVGRDAIAIVMGTAEVKVKSAAC
jgi:hypothetical protein